MVGFAVRCERLYMAGSGSRAVLTSKSYPNSSSVPGHTVMPFTSTAGQAKHRLQDLQLFTVVPCLHLLLAAKQERDGLCVTLDQHAAEYKTALAVH